MFDADTLAELKTKGAALAAAKAVINERAQELDRALTGALREFIAANEWNISKGRRADEWEVFDADEQGVWFKHEWDDDEEGIRLPWSFIENPETWLEEKKAAEKKKAERDAEQRVARARDMFARAQGVLDDALAAQKKVLDDD